MDHRLRQHLVRKITLKKNSQKNSKSDIVKASNNIFGVCTRFEPAQNSGRR